MLQLQGLFAMAGMVLALAAPAKGALVTFAFEGTVYDVPMELAESFHSGDQVSG